MTRFQTLETTGTRTGALQTSAVLDLTRLFFFRQKWTWGRWERNAALGNKPFYVSSTPPQGRRAQPPLTLFDYQQLLAGIVLVPYSPNQGAILTFDGSAVEVERLLRNQARD